MNYPIHNVVENFWVLGALPSSLHLDKVLCGIYEMRLGQGVPLKITSFSNINYTRKMKMVGTIIGTYILANFPTSCI